jgi:hypothetical protein
MNKNKKIDEYLYLLQVIEDYINLENPIDTVLDKFEKLKINSINHEELMNEQLVGEGG